MNEMSRRLLPPHGEADEPSRTRHPRAGPFGVLDIGTTKVACLIGRAESDGSLRVLGFGWQRGRGVRAGGIVDIEDAERAIRAAVGQAEHMADTRLHAVTVNLSCGQPDSRLFNVQWPIGNAATGGRVVAEQDVRRVMVEARDRSGTDGREILHSLPLSFMVDKTDHVADPRGLFCSTLTARLHIVDAEASALRTLGACIARCDLDIAEVVSAPMAAGLATLVEDERDMGATLIDMGGGTTGVAVFAEGHLLHTAQLPIGGMHITSDLARELVTTVAHAERMKTLHGNVQSCADDEREFLTVPLVGEDEHQFAKVPRSMVVNVVRPRVEEIFQLVHDRLESAGLMRAMGARVVLTGGACQLAGVRELAAHMLNKPVRLGRPSTLRGLPDSASGPAFATAAGLLAWAAGGGRTLEDIDLFANTPAGPVRRFLRYLKERF
jgi:cell division protein FtsA